MALSDYINQCQRCGTCCRKGPPTLHQADQIFFQSAVLQKQHLVTLRKGEWVYDNVQDKLIPLSEEIIRLRTKRQDKSCVFFQERENKCTIYHSRPLECRALKCWDTREIKDIYTRSRLKRLDLINPHSALADIIVEHEEQCSYHRVQELADLIRVKDDKAVRLELQRMIDMDKQWRSVFQEKTQTDQELLNFFFGRSLLETLPVFGIRINAQ